MPSRDRGLGEVASAEDPRQGACRSVDSFAEQTPQECVRSYQQPDPDGDPYADQQAKPPGKLVVARGGNGDWSSYFGSAGEYCARLRTQLAARARRPGGDCA
jgi:hypothetical protein